MERYLRHQKEVAKLHETREKLDERIAKREKALQEERDGLYIAMIQSASIGLDDLQQIVQERMKQSTSKAPAEPTTKKEAKKDEET
jgi:hypothetical protein